MPLSQALAIYRDLTAGNRRPSMEALNYVSSTFGIYFYFLTWVSNIAREEILSGCFGWLWVGMLVGGACWVVGWWDHDM